jgi:hypothetical protein
MQKRKGSYISSFFSAKYIGLVSNVTILMCFCMELPAKCFAVYTFQTSLIREGGNVKGLVCEYKLESKENGGGKQRIWRKSSIGRVLLTYNPITSQNVSNQYFYQLK